MIDNPEGILTDPNILPIKEEDIYRVYQFYMEQIKLFQKGKSFPLTFSDFQERINREGAIFLVKRVSDKVVGLLDVCPYSPMPEDYIVRWILVDPEFQKQGIGESLIKTLKARLDKRQIIASIDGDNEASIKIFERAGFKNDGAFHIFVPEIQT